MGTTQQRLEECAVPYQLGDLLEDRSKRDDTSKLMLRECPLCRTDPTRPRYHFADGESRPRHFRAKHDA